VPVPPLLSSWRNVFGVLRVSKGRTHTPHNTVWSAPSSSVGISAYFLCVLCTHSVNVAPHGTKMCVARVIRPRWRHLLLKQSDRMVESCSHSTYNQPFITTTIQCNKVEMQQGLRSLCKNGWQLLFPGTSPMVPARFLYDHLRTR
jgi:hypothetical protein